MKKDFDVVIIGGGPAGMMAAIKAGELGARAVLLEKNEKLGRKILLTGKGRCNITHAEPDLRKLAEQYGKNGNFLFRALSVFGVKDVVNFFESRGLKTKIERGNRVFPITDNAQDVLDVLMSQLKKNGVEIMTGVGIKRFEKEGSAIKRVVLDNNEITARNYILCTGGKSYPITGSTGDGYRIAEKLGHNIIEPKPGLVPLKIKEKWLGKLQGLSLKNVEISAFQNNKKITGRFGECLFTHFGLSGPIILDISGEIGDLLDKGEVKLSLDLKPALDFSTLDERIQKDFKKYKSRGFKNSLGDLLPQKLIVSIIFLSGIDPDKKVNSITKEERQKLARLLKSVDLTVEGLMGFDQAIVTRGGVNLNEIDHKTMKSKIIDNLYFAGEIIDIDGPTGGYNLQACWSTGYLAGESAANQIKEGFN